MRLYNTLSKTVEVFEPIAKNKLSFYACGPTVYDFAHIGHIRAYVFNDTLRRAFEYVGYDVRHVMNITDVGHLSDDADQGEDKMEKGARKYGKTVWDLAQYYTDFFFMSMDAVNILRPTIVCKATDHVIEMVAMVETLIKKGHAYETKEAVYFDVETYKEYGQLSGQNANEKKQGTRNDVYVDPEKRHSADFALWFKRVGKFKDHTMHWESPWGDGFPGWHIECSAMSMKYLGKTIDIHTGGIDHIPVHHENEIAQSEAANGVPFVHYWMHYHFLQVEGQKMSKSLGNFYTIEDIIKREIHPMAFRLLILQSHYRQPMNFTWQAVESVNEAYKKMKKYIIELKENPDEEKIHSLQAQKYKRLFIDAISNDLQTSIAVATLWTMLKDSQIPDFEKRALVADFDMVLGLQLLTEEGKKSIPKEITALAQKRVKAKNAKNFAKADELRKKIEESGYKIEDKKDGFTIK